MLNKIPLFSFFLVLITSCTHYKAISTEELQAKSLVGHWEMTLEPYFLDISCDGDLNFLKPSTSLLYGDQTGANLVITELLENKIIAGPILRAAFPVESWPSNSNGRELMTFDEHIWHKTKTYNCH